MQSQDRKFELHGNKCISCDTNCPHPWVDRSKSPGLFTGRLVQLGIVVDDKGSIRGKYGDYLVTVCLAGEKIPYDSQSVQRPELKQTDGSTPRVCLNHEDGVVCDILTSERFTGLKLR